jgi:carboxypeptidase family protein/TonB-dependent receptor-like protein
MLKTRVWGTIVLSLVFSVGLRAQVTTGTILGVVTDSTGAVVPGASLNLKNVETGISRTATSDNTGRYRAAQLALGSYEVTVEASGFQTAVRSGITLTVGREATVDFALQVGAVSERITVSGEAPLIETTNSTVSNLVDEKTMRDLPLNGRSYADLTSIQPGVISDLSVTAPGTGGVFSGGGSNTRRSISGTRPSQSTYLLDGMETSTPSEGMPVNSVLGQQLGVEAIREFTLLQSNFGAQFGRASGGVVNAVTQAGTNSFHGSVFEFLKNDKLNARDYFLSPSLPKAALKRNQFGAAIGGRLKKDRAFFFVNYEGIRQAQGNATVSTRITAETRTGQVTSCPSGLTRCTKDQVIKTPIAASANNQLGVPSPDVVPLMKLNDLPNVDYYLNGGVSDYYSVTPFHADENYGIGRFDYQISQNDSFFGRYTQDQSHSVSDLPQLIPGGYQHPERGGYIVGGISETHIFNSTFLNTARIAYTRRNDAAYNTYTNLDPAKGHFPLPASFDPRLELVRGGGLGNFEIPSGNVGPGVGTALFVDNTFDVEDSVNLTRGVHTIILGADLKRYRMNLQADPFSYGRMNWSTIENFLQNKPAKQQQSVSVGPNGVVGMTDSRRGFRQTYGAMYAQDDFRVRSNLTLNLGVRWEGIRSPREVNGKLAEIKNLFTDNDFTLLKSEDPFFKIHDSFKGFSPRFGFAWTPSYVGGLVVRGGFGVFKDMPMLYIFQLANDAPPYQKTYIINTPLAHYPFPFENVDLSPGSVISKSTSPSIMNNDVKLPYTMQWTLSLEKQLGQTLVVKANYVATRGLGIWLAANANQPLTTIVDGRQFTPNPTAAPVPNPNFNSFRYIDPASKQMYHSVQLVVEKRLSHGLRFNTSYTLAKNIDFGGGQGGTKGAENSGGGSSFRSANYYDMKGEKGLSSLHVKHNFTVAYSYDLPLGANQRWGSQWAGWMDRVAGGWSLSGSTSLRTGQPVTIGITGGSTAGLTGRSGCLAECDYRPDLIPGGNNNPVKDNWTPESYFDPTQFVLQPIGFFGNAGRNTIIKPSVKNFNVSFAKDSRISEGKSVEFRAEFFNLFNHPNFGAPNANIFRTAAGDYSATAGRITTLNNEMRQVQFALKLTF